ncbi:transposase [Gluconacetobacter liquefaciens]|uniref:Transposase n=1 Tax=Gluconacetobacter liquefaciens TaxID=89584 RepID=A0A370FTK5_GLULI|nr:transposase [Gluconacetobacter liquefaciens]
MKRSRFTQDQIIGVLKEHQAGASAADLCRKHGISDATFYTWRSKYGSRPNARFAAGGRDLGDPGERVFAATGQPADRYGPEDLALCVTPPG